MTAASARATLFFAVLLSMVNLKAAPPDDSAVIIPPSSTTKKWVLPDGLTIIVQEDHSAPVASVQAWCATGSIYEDEKLGAGQLGGDEGVDFAGAKGWAN